MKIYTRTGDTGDTSLFGGSRVSKASDRIETLGTIDEINAALGMSIALGMAGPILETAMNLQSLLFDLGADLAHPEPKANRITPDAVRLIEESIDRIEADLEPLRNFILPGGAPAAAALHVARCVCRRAERSLIALSMTEPIPETSVAFLNRLSDLFFVMARSANRESRVSDAIWRPSERIP